MTEKRDMIVIGTSIGGLAALRQIFSELPCDLPAAILVVMHIGSQESILPELLHSYSSLPVRHARDGESIERGTILVAPSDRHLLVDKGFVRLSHGPKENFSRPAIDPLFRSAALAYRHRVIGVVLTGNLDDGTIGLQVIKAYDGVAVVQDPEDAEMPSMPLSAIEHAEVDHRLPLKAIASALVELSSEPLHAGMSDPSNIESADVALIENRIVTEGEPSMDEMEAMGTPSTFTCPECQGALWEVRGARPQRFRCHTGHAFTARSLAAGQQRAAEEAIWAAVRALHEKATMLRRFAKLAHESNRTEAAAEHVAAAEQASHQADVLRQMVGRG